MQGIGALGALARGLDVIGAKLRQAEVRQQPYVAVAAALAQVFQQRARAGPIAGKRPVAGRHARGQAAAGEGGEIVGGHDHRVPPAPGLVEGLAHAQQQRFGKADLRRLVIGLQRRTRLSARQRHVPPQRQRFGRTRVQLPEPLRHGHGAAHVARGKQTAGIGHRRFRHAGRAVPAQRQHPNGVALRDWHQRRDRRGGGAVQQRSGSGAVALLFVRAGQQHQQIGRRIRARSQRIKAFLQLAIVARLIERAGQQQLQLLVRALPLGQWLQQAGRDVGVAGFQFQQALQFQPGGHGLQAVAGARQQIAGEVDLARPRRQHGLQVEGIGVLGSNLDHLAGHGQHLGRAAQFAQRGGVAAQERQVFWRQFQRAFEQRQRGGPAGLVAQQLGAKFQRADIVRLGHKRALCRVDGLDLFAAQIAQAADIDPQLRIAWRVGQGPVIGLPRCRQIAFQPLQPPQRPPAAPGGFGRELPRPQPFARFQQLALIEERLAHPRRDGRARRAGLDGIAQRGFRRDAIALLQGGARGIDRALLHVRQGRQRCRDQHRRQAQHGQEAGQAHRFRPAGRIA